MKVSTDLHLLPNVQSPMSKTRLNRELREVTTSFGDMLKEFVSDVNTLQAEAGKAIEKMVAGEATDIHDVMIAVEKAKTSFELLMELRNKTIDAYRELMRIQV